MALMRHRFPRLPGLLEVAGLLLWFVVFTRLHVLLGRGIKDEATANAATLLAMERAVGLDIEPAANRWLTEHPALIAPSAYYYRLYYAVVIGVLVWTYLRHREFYPMARRTLVAMTVLVLPVYWAVPMSPPRLALPGITDIMAKHDVLGGLLASDPETRNNYSAMPSMHVGFSLWCAFAVWCALRPAHPRLALLAWLFPAGMIAVVFVTGNHYVLDVVGSVVLLSAAIGVAWLCGRLSSRWRGSAHPQ